MTRVCNDTVNMTPEDMEYMSRALRHRLRNFASGVKAAITLLSEQLDTRLTPSEKEYFPLIAKECESLAEVTSRLSLLFEGAQDCRPGHLIGILEEARMAIEARYPLANIRWHRKGHLDNVEIASHTSLVAALKEIIANAIAVSSGREIVVQSSISAKIIEIAIQDHGAGLSPDNWACALQPFRMSNADHLGIGLAIASRLVASIGGRLQSRKEKRAFIVVIELPVNGDVAATAQVV